MTKGQKVRLKHGLDLSEIDLSGLVTNSISTSERADVNQAKDCYWYRDEGFYYKGSCDYDNELCIGVKKCKFYETEFQHQVREAIENEEKKEVSSKIKRKDK